MARIVDKYTENFLGTTNDLPSKFTETITSDMAIVFFHYGERDTNLVAYDSSDNVIPWTSSPLSFTSGSSQINIRAINSGADAVYKFTDSSYSASYYFSLHVLIIEGHNTSENMLAAHSFIGFPTTTYSMPGITTTTENALIIHGYNADPARSYDRFTDLSTWSGSGHVLFHQTYDYNNAGNIYPELQAFLGYYYAQPKRLGVYSDATYSSLPSSYTTSSVPQINVYGSVAQSFAIGESDYSGFVGGYALKGQMYMQRIILSESSTITSISLYGTMYIASIYSSYLQENGAIYPIAFKYAIYDDTRTVPVAYGIYYPTSADLNNNAYRVLTYDFSSPVTLPAGTYFVGGTSPYMVTNDIGTTNTNAGSFNVGRMTKSTLAYRYYFDTSQNNTLFELEGLDLTGVSPRSTYTTTSFFYWLNATGSSEDNFGNTTIKSFTRTFPENKAIGATITNSYNGTLGSVSVYVTYIDSGAAVTLQILNSSASVLLATTEERTDVSVGWNTFDLLTPISVSAIDYIVCVISDGKIGLSYDNGSTIGAQPGTSVGGAKAGSSSTSSGWALRVQDATPSTPTLDPIYINKHFGNDVVVGGTELAPLKLEYLSENSVGYPAYGSGFVTGVRNLQIGLGGGFETHFEAPVIGSEFDGKALRASLSADDSFVYNRPFKGDDFIIDQSSDSSADITIKNALFSAENSINFLPTNTIIATQFIDCVRIPNNGATFVDCYFISCLDTNGYFLWTTSTNVTNSTFSDNDYAIEIDTAGSYTLSGIKFENNTADINVTATSGTINISVAGGDTPTLDGTWTDEGGGEYTKGSVTVNIISGASLTLTGLKANSEVRAYLGIDPSTSTELGGVENSGTSFTMSHSNGGSDGYIQIHHTNYESITQPITYSSEDQTIPIQQRTDRQYDNPT